LLRSLQFSVILFTCNCTLRATYEVLKETKYHAAVSHPKQPTENAGRRRAFLYRLVIPVSPLTILTALGVLITIVALIRVSPGSHSSAMLAAISANLTFVLLILYTLDRLLIQHIAYSKLVLGELVFGLLLFFFVTFQNRTIELQVRTDQKYMLILFDSKENTLDEFHASGLWKKQLQVEGQTIIHLDSILAESPLLRIREPDFWMGFSQEEGRVELKGRSVRYLYRSNSKNFAEQAALPSLDSLLNALRQE